MGEGAGGPGRSFHVVRRAGHALAENRGSLPAFPRAALWTSASGCFIPWHEAGPFPSHSQLSAQTAGNWPNSGPCLDWSGVDSHLEGPCDLDKQLVGLKHLGWVQPRGQMQGVSSILSTGLEQTHLEQSPRRDGHSWKGPRCLPR